MTNEKFVFVLMVEKVGASLFRACGPFASTVGTEELGHLEMIGAIVHQLTRSLTDAQMEDYFGESLKMIEVQSAS